MKKALWIIAVATVVRVIQNAIQLHMLISEKEQRKRLNNEFIDSLHQDNKTWLHETLKGFDEIMRGEKESDIEEKTCRSCDYWKIDDNLEPCHSCRGYNNWFSANQRSVPESLGTDRSDG